MNYGDKNEKAWDEQMVGHLFPHEDAETILKIRIPQWDKEEYPAWHLETHGLFTVKSVYRLAWQCLPLGAREQGTSVAPDGEHKPWHCFWNT